MVIFTVGLCALPSVLNTVTDTSYSVNGMRPLTVTEVLNEVLRVRERSVEVRETS